MASQANLYVSAVMVLVLSCRLVVAYEEVKIAEKEINDGMAEKSMAEMFEKLEKTMSSDSCQGDAVPPPRPCIDLVSGQSVITQLCDRITSLEARLNRVTSHSAPIANNPENSDHTTHNSANQTNDLEKVKSELTHGDIYSVALN